MSFQSWLQDLHTTFVARRRPTGRRKPSAARRPRFRPAMESLEAREVPAILNVPPSGLTLALSEPTIGENGTAVLSGSFSDPDVLDTHLLTIDWGDGARQTVNLPAGVTTFSGLTHQYWDNLPGDAPYTISARVTDTTVVPLPAPFDGALSEGFESCSDGFTNEMSVFGGAAVIQAAHPNGLTLTRTGGWSASSVTYPHTGGWLAGDVGPVDWVFTDPVKQFGGWFASNSTVAGGTVQFFDAQNQLVATQPLDLPTGSTWTWNGWEVVGEPRVVRVRVTSNDPAGGGLIQFDDMQANTTAAVPPAQATAALVVRNVAPTATLSVPATWSEGSPFTAVLTGATDAGLMDRAAGYTYAFDFGDGYGAFGTTPWASFTPTDSGTQLVKAMVRDKDGGVTEYTANVAVADVAPTATLSNSGPVTFGQAVTVSFSNQFDYSPADTAAGFHYAYAVDSPALLGSATYGTSGSDIARQFSLPAGPHTVYARIIDKDGGFRQYATPVNVDKATPVVAAAGGTFTYDGLGHAATGSVTGVGGEDLGAPTFTYNGGSAAPVGAGTYAVVVSYAGSDNYAAGSATATLVIEKAAASVVVNGYSGVYDGQAHRLTGSATGARGEDLSGLLSLGDPYADAGTYPVAWSFAGDGNYLPDAGTAVVAIQKADQQITWAAPGAITYGTALGAAQLNATVTGVAGGSPAGAISYDVAAGAALPAGDHTLTVTAAETANYNAASQGVTLHVNKAALTVTVDDASRAYGDANPALTGTVTGVVAGDNITASFGTAATGTSPAGDYAITATLSDPDGRLANYTVSSPDGTLHVSKATLTVDVDAVSRTYGADNPALTGTVTGQKNGEAFAADYSTSAGSASPVGSYDVAAALAGATLVNYDVVVHGAGRLTVTPAALTVTPADVARPYGSPNPVLTGSVVGIQNGDNITATYATAATDASPAGTYDVTAGLADPDGKLGNYVVTSNVGHLAVTRADAAVVVNGYTGVYDGQGHGLTGSATGVNGEDLSGLLDLGAPQIDAGTYVTAWSFAGDDNYLPATGAAAVVIAKAASTTSVAGGAFTYDGTGHEATTASVSGAGGLSATPSLTYTDAAGNVLAGLPTNAGSYTVRASYAGDANHTGSSASAAITIARATPTVTAVGGSYTYDGQAHAATGSVSGVNGANLGTPTLTYSYTDPNGQVVTSGSAPVEPGSYTVTASFAGDANYSPASATATILIDYRVQSLIDLSKPFKAGSMIPIVIQLTDAAGNNLSSANTALAATRLERVNADGTRTRVTLQGVGIVNPGNLFLYSAALRGYVFLLNTQGLTAGTYDLFWTAQGDATAHVIRFQLV
jgi:hypothetical protein